MSFVGSPVATTRDPANAEFVWKVLEMNCWPRPLMNGKMDLLGRWREQPDLGRRHRRSSNSSVGCRTEHALPFGSLGRVRTTANTHGLFGFPSDWVTEAGEPANISEVSVPPSFVGVFILRQTD